MIILNNGNVGIGTTGPDKPLTIQAAATQLHLADTVSMNYGAYLFGDSGTSLGRAYIGNRTIGSGGDSVLMGDGITFTSGGSERECLLIQQPATSASGRLPQLKHYQSPVI